MNPSGTGHSEAPLLLSTDKIVGGSRWLGERRDLIRHNPYSLSTELVYLEWAKPYILFHGQRHHPKNGGVGNTLKPWSGSCYLTRFLSRLERRNGVARNGLWVPTSRFLYLGT